MSIATTKIWKVVSNFDYTIKYAENRKKTVLTGKEINSIESVINYASAEEKTTKNEIELVSAINCAKESAFEEMMQTKRKFGKTDKILAWHGYQSFKPGEVTPELAHQIGIELAKTLWGDRFQVVVTTHLDQKHIHNHFVLNSVSFLDGKKYPANKKTYFRMREVSDQLCYNYGLSVVENPKYNGISRGAYRASYEQRFSIEKVVKQIVDSAIKGSRSIEEFETILKLDGYNIDFSGKYVAVKVPGHRTVRIDRRFGNKYSYEGIQKQIDYYKEHPVKRVVVKKYVRGSVRPGCKISGLRGLYISYLFKLGVIPAKRQMSNRQMHYLLKEDLRHLDNLIAEMDFLQKNEIVNTQELSAALAEKSNSYDVLSERRKGVRNKIRRCKPEDKENLQKDLGALNEQLKKLRKEIFYCKDICERSGKMRDRFTEKDRSDENWKEEMNTKW